MSPPNQPRIRAKKPKTRTGCKTCRIRKIKCDEGKPFCARCLKFGVDCEGYEVGWRQYPSTTSKETLARKSHSQVFILPSIAKPPFNTAFQDNREYAYFLYFQEEAALDIAGGFDQSLWNHVIIQASWNELSLCQLVASLGALYQSTGPKALNLSKEKTAPHQHYAFQQYGRALKSVQARISTDQRQDATRIALIASLLIYCFENLYGELDTAIGHLEGALQLMRKQLIHANHRYKHSENVSPSSSLEGDLVAAFFRLDSGLLSREELSNAGAFGSRLDMSYLETVYEIPVRFRTISEARNFLESIQFPAVPSLSHDLLLRISNSPLARHIDGKAQDMYQTMSSQSSRWHLAFAPLYAATLTPTGRKDFVTAATLRIRALSTELASERVCVTELSSPYLFNPISREIVNLSRLVATDPSFLKSFVWDCGIVPGLSIVIAACLDMRIRKEALQLLKQIVPRREGVWDSVTAVKFGEICLQMN